MISSVLWNALYVLLISPNAGVSGYPEYLLPD